jgi:CheY-like chemotaxis protein
LETFSSQWALTRTFSAQPKNFAARSIPTCPAAYYSTCSFGREWAGFSAGSRRRQGISIPIIFVTAYGDVPSASRALRAGAIEFLMKPVQKHELLTAIEQALQHDRANGSCGLNFSLENTV